MKQPIKSDIFIKRILSDIKVGELDRKEVADLKDFINASSSEQTITGRTKLSVIYEIWVVEKSKHRKNKEMKKAEKILNSKTMVWWEQTRRKGYERDRQKRSKMREKWELESSHQSMNPLKDLKKNLKKIGIVKDEVINKILDTLKNVKKLACEIDAITELNIRVQKILQEFKGTINHARKKFSEQPMLLAKPDKQFNDLIKAMKLDIAHKNMSPEGTM